MYICSGIITSLLGFDCLGFVTVWDIENESREYELQGEFTSFWLLVDAM